MARIRLSDSRFDYQNVVFIAAIDPGETTGVATATLIRNDDGTWDFDVYSYEISWPEQAVELEELIISSDVIVVEDWRLRAGEAVSLTGDELPGVRALGAVEQEFHKHSMGRCLVKQQPLEGGWHDYAKAGLERLFGSVIWPTGSEHQKDALAHLIFFLQELRNGG